ncbi:phosphoenolpyruvate carboxykinase (ATP) [Clostridium sp. JN-1]|uniref:phosphoenolpyruvate carboxykinase (ATP) n=1 Tax=Clostridium sp. JN-1 TaxID=2483110 RepID=UPI000F0B8DBA|nr:phosphoenolpyruvate carboxykinase (ATP) [Clostridium sp. JN-1]
MCTDLNYLNIKEYKNLYQNLSVSELVELSIKRGEGKLSDTGALVINTGKYTGRSPKDRFIVKQKSTAHQVNWGDVNLPISEEVFNNLYKDVIQYLKDKDLFVFNGFVGAIKEYSLPIKVVCEYASQALFSTNLFRKLDLDEIDNFKAEFSIISAPGFKAKGKEDGINSEAFIIINFDKRIVLIGGTRYCGEIKKAVFSIMNFLLPKKHVMPMHCSANIDENQNTTIFFGLSGTGKTTLSADPLKKLIGDDEHGWSDKGVFNFEGGCYAKTIRLDKDKEKEIYNAIKFGTVLENVVVNSHRQVDYNNNKYTENTRAAYPLEYIKNVKEDGIGKVPKTIIFLTADAFGVIPPISKLSREAALYHFISGYTSKVAGTERGIVEPKVTFSACFGEPFMLLDPYVYAKLLGENIDKYGTHIYLVNTGWLSGGFKKGSRIKLSYTRAMINAAIDGKLEKVKFVEHPIFKVLVPQECPGVPSYILNPINTWENKKDYIDKTVYLAHKFEENFKKFKHVPESIINAGPAAPNDTVKSA